MAAYRTLVVGMGKRGKHHAFAFHANPNFEVVGICDVVPDALPGLAAQLGNPAVGSDAARMARDLKPDVFCFCTHPTLRYNLIKVGVEAGARLIAFEKPLALTSIEAKKIQRLAAAAGVKMVLSHQHRYGPHYRKVKEIIESGALGRVHTVYATTPGWMLHMMTHMINYMCWYNGDAPADWVMAQAAGRGKLKDNHPSPDYIAGIIQFANGVRGYIEAGAGAPDQPEVAKWWGKNRIGAQGTDGFAEVLTNGGWRAVTKSGAMSGDGKMDYDADMPPYVRDMADWLNGTLAEHPCSLAQAYPEFEIMAGLCRSVIQRGQVALPLTDDGMDELAGLAAVLPDTRALLGSPLHAAEFGG